MLFIKLLFSIQLAFLPHNNASNNTTSLHYTDSYKSIDDDEIKKDAKAMAETTCEMMRISKGLKKTDLSEEERAQLMEEMKAVQIKGNALQKELEVKYKGKKELEEPFKDAFKLALKDCMDPEDYKAFIERFNNKDQ